MGVALTPIIVRDTPALEALAGRRLAGYEAVRAILQSPNVTSDYTIAFREPEDDAVIDFLVAREFSRERIVAALERMKGKPTP